MQSLFDAGGSRLRDSLELTAQELGAGNERAVDKPHQIRPARCRRAGADMVDEVFDGFYLRSRKRELGAQVKSCLARRVGNIVAQELQVAAAFDNANERIVLGSVGDRGRIF